MTERITQQQFGRIEELIGKLETTADPAARATARELVQLLMEIHGAGLERMMEIATQSGELSDWRLSTVSARMVTRNLLLLYGLHPVDLDTRVAGALEGVRPYLRSRDASVELISITAGNVIVRLNGNAHGCTASTLKAAIEEALYKEAPDLVSVSVESETAAAASVFIPLGDVRIKQTGR